MSKQWVTVEKKKTLFFFLKDETTKRTRPREGQLVGDEGNKTPKIADVSQLSHTVKLTQPLITNTFACQGGSTTIRAINN